MLANKSAGRLCAWLTLTAVFVLTGFQVARGQRPAAPHLLPENTVAYIRVHNGRDLVERLRHTAMGQVFRDEQVRPLLSDLYESANDTFRQVENELGLSLNQLLAIPQGEVCVALVAPAEGTPAFIVLVEAGDQLPAARTLVDRVQAEIERRSEPRTNETWEGTELTILQPPRRSDRRVVFFERDKTIGVATNVELAKGVLSVWNGAKARTLADNRDFTAIMKRCAGSADERPEVTYFLDPIDLVKSITYGNAGAQITLAMLQPLGLEDVLGVGGSFILNSEQFESIHHIHILLDTPRTGVLAMLALRSGDVTPEPWTPNDVSSYMTVHWDFAKTYSQLARLYDRFRGDGAWEESMAKPFSSRLGVDLEKDFVDSLDGRVTLTTWMEKPPRVNSQATLIGLKLKDAEAFRPALDKVVSRAGNAFGEEAYAGVNYFHIRQQRTPPNFDAEVTRLPDPCLAILGDYLLLTDSSQFLKRAIATKKGSTPPLSSELDFKLIASRIGRQPGGDEPNLVSFSRPEETLRSFYELARTDRTRRLLSNQAEKNRLFKALHEAMSKHPLPPFAVLAKYFAPTGGLITDDETGIHSVSFSLKRD